MNAHARRGAYGIRSGVASTARARRNARAEVQRGAQVLTGALTLATVSRARIAQTQLRYAPRVDEKRDGRCICNFRI